MECEVLADNMSGFITAYLADYGYTGIDIWMDPFPFSTRDARPRLSI